MDGRNENIISLFALIMLNACLICVLYIFNICWLLVLDCVSTIAQVTIARVYNWDVHQRRIRQAATTAAAKDS